MEELLQDISKEANGSKLASLRKACQDAIDLLALQQNASKDPSCELRRICFIPLQIALETKKAKLVTLSLSGFHKILRDDRFHRGCEPEDDSLWLPSQLLCATASMMYHLPETQVHILRVYLSLALCPRRTLNGRLVLWACGRCAEAAPGPPPVAAAARAAASQTVRAFTAQLDEECQEILSESSPMGCNKSTAVSCFSEVIPVIQYLCSRLAETQVSNKHNSTAIFFLECLLTLMSSLPEQVSCNTHFTTFLWQKFCPSLISFLGTPRVDKNIKSKERVGHNVDDSGRGAGALVCAPSFNSRQAKIVYSIAGQLVRLVGCIAPLRPVLEALYHRMLLYPRPPYRAAPLQSARDLLRNPTRLSQLILLKRNTNTYERHSDDMAIIRLIMDAIEECGHCNDPAILQASLECVVSLLGSLQDLCAGLNLPENSINYIDYWPQLEDADYMGPLTYQSLARLPSPYRDVVAGMQSADEKDSDSSDTSGPEVHSSASDAEVDSDADSVFLPSREPDMPEQTSTPSTNDMNGNDKNHYPINVPKNIDLGRCNVGEYNVDLERHNAKQFMKTIQNVLVPKLFSLRTCVEVDEAMQDFASRCCQYNAAQPPTASTIMNADGVYLATYSALLLNLKLIRLGYYVNPDNVNLPISEDKFVEEVQGSGMLVYLSATWLREVYQQVLASSILEIGGYREKSDSGHIALINLLIDLGGLGSSQIMCDWQRLKEVSTPHYNASESASEIVVGLRLARRILTCIWDSMVSVLSVPLTGRRTKKERIHGLISQRIGSLANSKRVAWEGLVNLCLEGLHKAARVSTTLGLQTRCSSLLALLASSACSQLPNGKILSTHALSLDILITGGLELGSKAPDCWEHIFTACQYVSSLEHSLFGHQPNSTTPIITLHTGRNKTISMLHTDSTTERLNYSYTPMLFKEDETCVDVYNFLQSNIDNPSLNTETSVVTIIQKCQQEANKGNGNAEVLQGTNAAKICCALSYGAETLFTDAANKLTLPTLISFLTQLCKSSHQLLFIKDRHEQHIRSKKWWGRGRSDSHGDSVESGARLLCRTGDVALRCLRAPRPLAHHMAVWAIVGPHFMQAACHKEVRISRCGIQCMSDAIATLLGQTPELPHFHFHEALLKPFENLLCLELCDTYVQEQIISCICEFVETNRLEIKSGWRPLFNTLRAANNSSQHAAILEIFRVFLSTDNTLVFANAALDCILCLLSHVKGLHSEISTDTDFVCNDAKIMDHAHNIKFNFHKFAKKNSKFIPITEEKRAQLPVDMCKESLNYLESCAEILTMMYNMPKCPTFNTGHRIKSDMQVAVVDPFIPSGSIDVTTFVDNQECKEEVISYKILATNLPSTHTAMSYLLKLDKQSNILKVWYLLIEGLVSATVVCPKPYQPTTMETLFKLLRNIVEIPGTNFGLHCINHLLLPAIQNWLRQLANTNSHWDAATSNFKQCCGMTTDTIVIYLQHLQILNANKNSTNSQVGLNDDMIDELIEDKGATFALKQILLILVECVAQPQEMIARLGASCIRHIILTSGHLLTNNQWEIVCISLHRACNVSLTPLKQLTLAFQENSNSFYGDVAMVKVAARRDCTINDNVRLHAMAQQVFFNDNCRNDQYFPHHAKYNYNNIRNVAQSPILTDDRSYIFLLYLKEVASTLNPELYMVRIHHRSVIVGLLAHQILIQIVATVLFQASSDVIHSLSNILLDSWKTSGVIPNRHFYLNEGNKELLLKSLELSYKRAIQFDARPGLKFLVQKVSNLDYAANLYKQTTSSWLIRIITLMEMFFTGVEKFKLKSSDLTFILDSFASNLKYSHEYDRFIKKIFDLKSSWELLCNLYIRDVEESEIMGQETEVKQSLETSCQSSGPQSLELPIEIECEDVDIKDLDETKSEDQESEEPKPFTFADFKDNVVDIDKNDKPVDVPDSISVEDKNGDDSILNEVISNTEKHEDSVIHENIINKINSSVTDHSLNLKKTDILNQSKKDSLLPPQPVPPEIEQQRIHSINRDAELRKSCILNILMAYLELILSFPLERFEVLCPILDTGLIDLSRCTSEVQLINRITALYNRKDTV